jgi:hypothetical protein
VRQDVRRVVEHLPHDLTSDPAIAGPLHLDERRHSLGVEEQVIKEPAVGAALGFRHPGFSANEQVLGRTAGVRCLAEQELGVGLEQFL